MTQDVPKGPGETRRIQDAYEVGAINSGQDVVLNLRMEDGSKEWFSIHHTRVGELVAGIVFAAGIAAKERPNTTPNGNPLPEQSHLIDPTSLGATSFPGATFAVLRLEIGHGVNLDFRIPLSDVETIQESLSRAVSLARSGKPPVAH